MLVNFNGNIIQDSELGFDLLYRATMFGDGLFESIYVEKNEIYLFKEHLFRLESGMDCLHLTFEKRLSIENWLENISLLIRNNTQSEYLRIRILVWRKGKGTYNTSNNESANFLIFSEEAKPFEIKEIQTVSVSKTIKISNTWYGDHKTINALNYVGASIEKSNHDSDELLLGNENGDIIEAVSSNILCVKDDIIYVPKKDSGQVNGIMNDFLIAYFKKEKAQILEKNLSEEDIYSSDLIIYCNSFIIKLLINSNNTKIIDKLRDIKGFCPKQPLPL